MSRPYLIPYAGKDKSERPVVLSPGHLRRKVLRCFREGLRTDQIARDLSLEECEVAKALAEARDAERSCKAAQR